MKVFNVFKNFHSSFRLLNYQELLDRTVVSDNFNLIISLRCKAVLRKVVWSCKIKYDVAHVGELIEELEVQLIGIVSLVIFKLSDFFFN